MAQILGRASTTRNPGLSVTRVILVKVRVILEFVARSIIEFREIRVAHRSIKRLRGVGGDRAALVIANGPSASHLNLEKTKELQSTGQLDVFVMNFFAASKAAQTVVPNFYVLSDPLTHPARAPDDERVELLWSYIRERDSISVIVPHTWYGSLDSSVASRSRYLDDRELIGWSRSISPKRPRGYMSMTAFKALAFSIFMGHQTIYVIGLDNSMYLSARVDSDNRIIEQSSHFFGKSTERNVVQWYPSGMSDYLYDHSRLFLHLKHMFGSKGIINLDADSLTDAFPKVTKHPLIDVDR